MMDFCKNHCKIEVCKLLKKEVKKWIKKSVRTVPKN
jgi:hypothetical protein